MAATGKTPILLYGSITPTNAPVAGNLTNSSDGCEIAINVADKNLFFKDSTNTVNTVPIRQSSASSDGWLSSTDWSTFNNKQPAGTYVTSVTGTAPVVSSGGTTPAISMAAANASTNGYLTSTDWNTFNGKAPAFSYTTNYIPFGQGTTTPNQSSNLTFDGTILSVGSGSTGIFAYTSGALGTYRNNVNYVHYITNLTNSGGCGFTTFQYGLSSTQLGSIATDGTSLQIAGVNKLQLLGGSTVATTVFPSGGVSIGNTTDPGATNLSVSGNVVIATSGKGIDFSATAGTGTSELLADYEEGTFTATLAGGTTNPSTPVTKTGYYTKIGDMVSVYINFNNVDTTGASGQVQVTGLPYTASSSVASSGTIWINQASTTGVITIEAGATSLGMLSFTGSSANWSGVGAGCYTRMQITYKSA